MKFKHRKGVENLPPPPPPPRPPPLFWRPLINSQREVSKPVAAAAAALTGRDVASWMEWPPDLRALIIASLDYRIFLIFSDCPAPSQLVRLVR